MTRPINPYIAGNPVGDTLAFIGRADVLRNVSQMLRRPKDSAIVLYGQRRIGKTSILQQLAAWLPRGGPYLPVYFDLQDKAALPLGQVLQDLAQTIAYHLGLSAPTLGDDPERNFRDTWLRSLLHDLPKDSALILLFDEFDVLATPQAAQAAAAFFPYLRSLLTSNPRRLKFVFVIGRNVNDLTNVALALFKDIPSTHITLLSKVDTIDLIRLSEKPPTLMWPDEAVDKVWQLTSGHPFLTQQLCSQTWEIAHDEVPDSTPVVTLSSLETALPRALDTSRSALEWLWSGLPPAGRVVISALASAGAQSISQDTLETLLRDSGMRLVIRELQTAPQLLEEWDLIEPADTGYRFRVELFRRWIAQYKPLLRVKEEMDRIEPVADSLYRAGVGLYRMGQLDPAATQLQQAIELNPNHIGATQLLADILLAQGHSIRARELLEKISEYQPESRPRLIQALISEARIVENDDERLRIYERVLSFDPDHLDATSLRRAIWEERGVSAQKEGDLETALRAYQTINLVDKATEIEQLIRQRDIAACLQEIELLEHNSQFVDALQVIRESAAQYPEARDWASDHKRLEHKTHLNELYLVATDALNTGDKQTAMRVLIQIIDLEPEFMEATRYLHLAIHGEDVAKLRAELGQIHAQEKHSTLIRSVFRARPGIVYKLLASLLIWLPVSLTAMLITVRAQAHAGTAQVHPIYYWIGLGLMIAWFLSAWLSDSEISDLLRNPNAVLASAQRVPGLKPNRFSGKATYNLSIFGMDVWKAISANTDPIVLGSVLFVFAAIAVYSTASIITYSIGHNSGTVLGIMIALVVWETCASVAVNVEPGGVASAVALVVASAFAWGVASTQIGGPMGIVVAGLTFGLAFVGSNAIRKSLGAGKLRLLLTLMLLSFVIMGGLVWGAL